ncbi:hypothetical protein H9P43_008951 [Blastocladiella emersonii ATCC 22665]|nr:hypothetical protein H9P43_008951 [Blastocladiella emersonii ATCC 22665]
MALVEVQGVGDLPPTFVVRLVPLDAEGTPFLPQLRFRKTLGQTGSEHPEESIIATSQRYADLEAKARALASSYRGLSDE